MQYIRTPDGQLTAKVSPSVATKMLETLDGYVTYKNFKSRGKVKVFVSKEDVWFITSLCEITFFKAYYLELE